MKKYVCIVCGYVYDPEEGDPDNGIAAGTSFADLPDDWTGFTPARLNCSGTRRLFSGH